MVVPGRPGLVVLLTRAVGAGLRTVVPRGGAAAPTAIVAPVRPYGVALGVGTSAARLPVALTGDAGGACAPPPCGRDAHISRCWPTAPSRVGWLVHAPQCRRRHRLPLRPKLRPGRSGGVAVLLHGRAKSAGQSLVVAMLGTRLRRRGVPLGTGVGAVRPVSALEPPIRGLPVLRRLSAMVVT